MEKKNLEWIDKKCKSLPLLKIKKLWNKTSHIYLQDKESSCFVRGGERDSKNSIDPKKPHKV